MRPPLAGIEHDIAIDATGFSTSTYVSHNDEKWGRMRKKKTFVKAHAACGTETHIVTNVLINGRGDATQFEELLKGTAERFAVERVTADKAYSSYANHQAAEALGAVPYIMFKDGTTGKAGPPVWKRMFHYYRLHEDKFREHYHRRSNVETAFSMIKAKFGGNVRSKSPTAQANELYCKFLCHNIVVLISSMYELGVVPDFWPDAAKPQAVP